MTKKKAIDILEDAVEDAITSTNLPSPNLSLGSDLLDLFVSGTVGKAVSAGSFLWFHGSSGSGKSFHAKVVLAEAANNPAYADHRFVIFDGENGSNFDCEKFFGRKLASKLESLEAASLDHLYDALDTIVEKPAVIVVDSWDSWLTAAAAKKLAEDKKKRSEDKDPEGDYGMDHGKVHSRRLRELIPKLAKTNSIIIGISQHRDNVNKNNAYSPKDVVPGGRALKFWAHVELEMTVSRKITKEVNKIVTPIGDTITVKVNKNRVNGLRLTLDEDFYPTVGIDNIGSTLNWLVENKYLSIAGGRYKLPFFEAGYFRDAVIAKIEAENQEENLRKLLGEGYSDYMSQVTVQRKSKYD
jgi:RecA/RadA recombinase